MKTLVLEGIGEVTLKKSVRAKRLILKITQSGEPVVVIPSYVPYVVAERFARQHKSWFQEHAIKTPKLVIHEGKLVGGTYKVQFVPKDVTKPSSRITGTHINVSYPGALSVTDDSVQSEAKKACIRALRKLAEAKLPSLLHENAHKYGFKYSEVRIKTVHTRWGSCSSNKIINLSVWLMQLPPELMEYVICHELAHLNFMHHQPAFWNEVERMVPDHKARRKALKEYRPELI